MKLLGLLSPDRTVQQMSVILEWNRKRGKQAKGKS